VISVYVRQHGVTSHADRIDPSWLDPASGAVVWVDFSDPTEPEQRLLSDVFHFHALAIEDAVSSLQFPKVEAYDGYLYIILHGIDFQAAEHRFATRDIDFFVGPSYLVTVHGGTSRSVGLLREICERHGHVLDEGPVGLLHRLVDTMVDNYQPEMEKLEDRISQLEEEAYIGRTPLVRELMGLKRDLASMRRILMPQRDVVGRLARREFPAISVEMAYRFRDVYDHLVRYADETLLFQDRATGILEVNLAAISTRLNQIMKVLTIMSTIFLPLTVVTGIWGMNLRLPLFPGGEAAQFWWLAGLMLTISVTMLLAFRRMDWF
jgi:magnesium transporter